MLLMGGIYVEAWSLDRQPCQRDQLIGRGIWE
jgi:hypothetical protein